MASCDSLEKSENHLLLEDNEEYRYCWVCFSTEYDDEAASWVHPCICRGSTKWVHQLCLQRWVDEKQEGNLNEKVCCPQCNTEYIIVSPEMSYFIFILGLIDRTVKKVYPFVAAGILISALHWIAVTFGAVTILQVLGNKSGLKALEHADPWTRLIGLPTIPIAVKIIGNGDDINGTEQVTLSISMHTLLISLPAIPLILILGKMITWEDSVLLFLRKYSTKLPILKHIMPSFSFNSDEQMRNNFDSIPAANAVSVSGIFCGALLLPTISTACGKILYNTISSKLLRTVLGGLTFIILKGFLKIYYKQQLYIRQNKKIILNYVPPIEQ